MTKPYDIHTITNVVGIYTTEQTDKIRHIAIVDDSGNITELVLYANNFATAPKTNGLKIRTRKNAGVSALEERYRLLRTS